LSPSIKTFVGVVMGSLSDCEWLVVS